MKNLPHLIRLLCLAFLVGVYLTGCRPADQNNSDTQKTPPKESPETTPNQDAQSMTSQNESEPTMQSDQTDNPHVIIDTTMGQITLELYPDKAPITVENFLTYVKDGHYDGTIFHRVIPGFMIQGGGMTPDMQPKPTRAPIKNEADNGLSNQRGTIAMARTSDPDSATAQFFINVNDNLPLNYRNEQNPGYAVFGKVTDGMEVADKIVAVPTTSHGPHQNVPRTPVIINTIEPKP